MAKGYYGVHIFTHKGSDYTDWYKKPEEQHAAYLKAKSKVGPTKTRKTPYRYVKKVGR